jgi:hypothetical protein
LPASLSGWSCSTAPTVGSSSTGVAGVAGVAGVGSGACAGAGIVVAPGHVRPSGAGVDVVDPSLGAGQPL